MGTLRSLVNHAGLEVNGIALGSPIECSCDPCFYSWDDAMLPSGEIDEAGNLTLDVSE
jgi:hypothetical protein